MKKLLFILFISAAISFPGISQSLENKQLSAIDNNIVEWNSVKGQNLTLIDFWASWCKPCIKAMPFLNDLHIKYKDNGLQVIGISTDGPRSISKVQPLINSMKIQYPIFLDMDEDLSKDLNIYSLPTILLVNDKNKVIWRHEGFSTGDQSLLENEIIKHLGKANKL